MENKIAEFYVKLWGYFTVYISESHSRSSFTQIYFDSTRTVHLGDFYLMPAFTSAICLFIYLFIRVFARLQHVFEMSPVRCHIDI